MSHCILIHNLDYPSIRPIRARYCDSFFCRLRGLTFRKQIEADEGLLLVQARDSRLDTSIHMLAVWTELTVVWINANMNVVDKVLARPWHPAYFPHKPAKYILEIHPDRWDDFHIGNKVQFKDA